MFFGYLWRKKWLILGYGIFAVLASSSMAVFNLQIAPLMNEAQLGDYGAVIPKLGIMFLWFLANRLLEYYTELSGIHIVNLVRRDIKHDLFGALMGKQLPAFADRDTGEYIAEFTNDITVIENKFLLACKEIVGFTISIITTGAAILTIDVRMALVILVGVAICVGLPMAMTPFTSSKMSKFLYRFDRYVQYLKDSFGAFFTFKNFAVEDRIVENFQVENSEVERDKFGAEFALIAMNNLVGRFAWAIELMVVVIGLLGVMNSQLDMGSVFSAYLLAGSLGIPLQSFGGRLSMIRSVKAIEEKFRQLQDLEDKVEPDAALLLTPGPFDVSLEQIELQVKGSTILSDVSVTFEHGKKYLIVGSNGSGKSTTAKLMKGNYTNYRGHIRLGGYDLNSPGGAGLSRNISYSNETVALISDTVRNNILLYRDAPQCRLEEAVKLADLRVPLDRMVGDGGRFLSSGERRKLELARALINDPQVMILDEVVSTLDIETAYEIEKLVLSLEGRTVIMISNAFSGQLLKQYDQVILMDHGHVSARGTHEELLASSEQYRQICSIRCAQA